MGEFHVKIDVWIINRRGTRSEGGEHEKGMIRSLEVGKTIYTIQFDESQDIPVQVENKSSTPTWINKYLKFNLSDSDKIVKLNF